MRSGGQTGPGRLHRAARICTSNFTDPSSPTEVAVMLSRVRGNIPLTPSSAAVTSYPVLVTVQASCLGSSSAL